jgi:hypothetical protein
MTALLLKGVDFKMLIMQSILPLDATTPIVRFFYSFPTSTAASIVLSNRNAPSAITRKWGDKCANLCYQ